MTAIERQIYCNNLLTMCPECSEIVITDDKRGETKCPECGLVLSEKEIDLQFERNIFNATDTEKKLRVGPPITVFTINLSDHTKINRKEIISSDFRRIAKWDKYDQRNRSLALARIELQRIGAYLRIPESIQAIGFFLCKKAMNLHLSQGRSIENIVAACVYYACRKVRLPVGFHEIVNGTNHRDARKIQKAYSILFREFKLKVPPMGPEHFLSRYITELELPFEFEKKTKHILNKMPMSFILGKDPKCICAALIYFLSKKKEVIFTQKFLAMITGSTTQTVRNHYKKIRIHFEKKDKKM